MFSLAALHREVPLLAPAVPTQFFLSYFLIPCALVDIYALLNFGTLPWGATPLGGTTLVGSLPWALPYLEPVRCWTR